MNWSFHVMLSRSMAKHLYEYLKDPHLHDLLGKSRAAQESLSLRESQR